MAVVGEACLILALVVALWGVGAALTGALRGRRDLVRSARRAVYALALLITVAFAVVEAAFLRDDFAFTLVAGHSSQATPLFYKATAMWSSQEGSLLLWVWLLSLWSALVLFATRRRLRDVVPYATATLCGFAAFFLALLVFLESPFATVAAAAAPADGAGLNPLLRHPSMMIHPPTLYAGYTLFAVPFAFAVGALVVRRVGAEWIRATRRFTLAAWAFLGLGIMLGARWSYTELGWGGYWAWDPVENASLLPWLTGTALLHSVMIQERRGMLKVWNASLVLLTGTLAVLGTFLVRSGILDSIHAFGASTLGVPFVTLIGAMVAGSVYLVVTRRHALRSEHRLDSLFSREAVFLANNLVLCALAFAIFWLTFFPLISEALTGQERSAGPPVFNLFAVPLTLIVVLLSGLAPVIAWRRQSLAGLRRNVGVPALAGLAVLVAGAALGAASEPAALVMFALGAFVAAAVTQEFVRGGRARRAVASESWPAALVQLTRRNRRRYGGYLVHLGIAVLFVGIAASSAFQDARDVQLAPGDRAEVGGYTFVYEKPKGQFERPSQGRPEYIALGARLRVEHDGRAVGTVATERRFFVPDGRPDGAGVVSQFFEGNATSEVGLDAGLFEDKWVAVEPDITRLRPILEELDQEFVLAIRTGRIAPLEAEDRLFTIVEGLTEGYVRSSPTATFRVLVSPMVSWMWIGVLVVGLGALVAFWPPPRPRRRAAADPYAARVARDLARA